MRATANRRIGARVPTALTVAVRPDAARAHFGRAKWFDATIVNLSVSGAEIEAKAIPGLALRSRAVLRTEDGTATVDVRRLAPLDRRRVRYGVAFVNIDAPLRLALNVAATGHTGQEPDWRWDTAR